MKALNVMKAILASVAVATLFAACGGGGGNTSAPIVSYPYETVYGDTCVGYQTTPGCTFNRDGSRVTVSQDPNYNQFGSGSNDLWFVKFNSSGTASVYNDLGQFQYTTSISSFAGWIGGTTIGVGTSGLFWENVSGGTYWFGKNGVLYSANTFAGNYGQAINNKTAGEASDTSFAALNSDANVRLVKKGTEKLMKDYGFTEKKATAVASALNSWAVAGAERGYTTDKDMDKTFKAVFGVDFYSALSAVKDLQGGDTSSMRALTDRSAAALGLRPDQAQKFVKGMYKKALAQWGIDGDSINW